MLAQRGLETQRDRGATVYGEKLDRNSYLVELFFRCRTCFRKWTDGGSGEEFINAFYALASHFEACRLFLARDEYGEAHTCKKRFEEAARLELSLAAPVTPAN